MTREEAINEIKSWDFLEGKEIEAIHTLIPELKESEDERIRKWLMELVKSTDMNHSNMKLSENCKLALVYLEKQKDASKAIEAVDRIDKYIDEHLANAHDMKDSNPDKKYYRGWDDALGKMAGILQDVYSGGKPEESLRDFIDDFPYSDQKEQKHVEVKQNPLIRMMEDKKAITEDIRNGIPTKTIEKERNVKFATPVDVSHAEWSEDKFPKDIEKDAVQFCFDKGINITPHQAKEIATHYLMVGHNEGYVEGRKNAHIPAKELGLPSSMDFKQKWSEEDRQLKGNYNL